MTKEEFIATSKNIHTYRIEKKLPGSLAYLNIGDKISSSTLYDRGYNILKFWTNGYLRNIDEPHDWQQWLVGKNEHSVYVRCGECGTIGVNLPLDIKCGNCGYEKCLTYYDAQTIDMLIQAVKRKLI